MPKAHVTLALIIIVIIGLLAIWYGGTSYKDSLVEPIIPENTHSEVISWPQLGSVSNQDNYVIAYNSTAVMAKFECGSIRSLNGYWYGLNALLEIHENNSVINYTGAPAYENRTWGDTIKDPFSVETYPYFTASLPITSNDLHKTLHLWGSMYVNYPVSVGNSEFQITSETVTREIDIFVCSPEELQLKQKIDNYHNLANLADYIVIGGSVVWVAIGILLILHYATSSYLLKRPVY